MIQDITSHTLSVDFERPQPKLDDYVLLFVKNEVLVMPETGALPMVSDWKKLGGTEDMLLHVMHTETQHYFIVLNVPDAIEAQLRHETVRYLRTVEPDWLRLASVTGLHLYQWHRQHRFCGVCGAPMLPDEKELAMRCTNEECRCVTYPTVCPAVIIAIVNKDKILLTKSAVYKQPVYALVSGYMNPGETMEQAAAREAFEETGLHVKNIRYYGNQPWGFSGAQMIGFWAELDGDDTVKLQEDELKEATWFLPEEMPETPDPIDLTHFMMEQFRQRKMPFQNK